ncbi:MAG: hypothetical protein J7L47_03065 [Candidatus Odinarchaeota archaeon]|nr:hypothetical protein [Candidatus Odinarchaeota archaeon]
MVFGKSKKLKQKLVQLILQKKIVTLNDAAKYIGVSLKKAEDLLIDIEEEQLVNGFYDDEKKKFLLIDKELIKSILSTIKSEGIVKFVDLSRKFGVSEIYIKDILAAAVTKKVLKGYYMLNYSGFATIEGLEDFITHLANERGYFLINNVASEINLDVSILREVTQKLIESQKIRGVLTRTGFVSFEKLSDDFLNQIRTRGSVTLKEISGTFSVPEKESYTVLRRLAASGLIFLLLDPMIGDYIIFDKKIWNDAISFVNKTGLIDIVKLAGMNNIPTFLARSVVEKLVNEYKLVGVWTIDGTKFITAEAVYGTIKDDLKREVLVSDIAYKIGLPLSVTRKLLDGMIREGYIRGFLADGGTLFIPVESGTLTEAVQSYMTKQLAAKGVHGAVIPQPEASIDTEIIGGEVVYTLTLRNLTTYVITDITLNLKFPDRLKPLKVEPAILNTEDNQKLIKKGIIKISSIQPMDYVSVDVYFEPTRCGKMTISGVVNYKDATGQWKSLAVNDAIVEITCPESFEPEEANLAMLDNLMRKIALSDNRRFLLVIDGKKALNLVDRVIRSYNIYKVHEEVTSEDPFEAEAWYFTRLVARKIRLVIKTSISKKTKSIEIIVACDDPVALAGVLGKISDDLSRRLFLEEQKELVLASGNFKTLQCSCGAPLPRLPTPDEPVTCEFCGRTWTYADMK